jgi:hypothetical protein
VLKELDCRIAGEQSQGLVLGPTLSFTGLEEVILGSATNGFSSDI